MKAIISKFTFTKEYFLFLFPLFYVLNRFAENYPLVSLVVAGKVLIIYLLSFLSLNFLLWLFFKNWRKASVYNFYVMCWYFLFGVLHDFLKNNFGNTVIAKYTFLLPLIIFSLIFLFIIIRRSTSSFNRFSNYANALLLVLIAIEIVRLLFSPISINKPEQMSNVNSTCDSCSKPDIYLIIADEYAGDKQLREMFGFDNSGFNTELKKRRFHTIRNPLSNYNYTPYSVASLLNMDYLPGITEKANDQKNRNTSFTIINKNQTFDILRQHEYSFINHSLFDVADNPAPIDNMFFKTRDKLITTHTLFGRIKRDLWFNLVTTFKVDYIRKQYAMAQVNGNKKLIADLKKTVTTRTNSPRFVYTHLNMPHYPYTHNRNGQLRSTDTILDGNHNDKELYIDYLLYTNNQLLNIIDHILERNSRPAAIMLLSDHGFREFNQSPDSLYNFSTINHIYLPDLDYVDFKDGQSHVNHFRVFFNKQFNMNLPMLKDTTFFMKEY